MQALETSAVSNFLPLIDRRELQRISANNREKSRRDRRRQQAESHRPIRLNWQAAAAEEAVVALALPALGARIEAAYREWATAHNEPETQYLQYIETEARNLIDAEEATAFDLALACGDETLSEVA